MFLEETLQHYPLPFKLRDDQIDAFDFLIGYDRGGCFYDVGLGKTVISTLVTFYRALQGQISQAIVLMPPILLSQWGEWLLSFPGIEVCIYAGAPAARKKLSFDKDFTLMTPQIFKRDYARICEAYKARRIMVIVDEATCIRRVNTFTHKAVRDFVEMSNNYLLLLTGTAISAPIQCYGYIKLLTPWIYRDLNQFIMVHVEKTDIYGEPSKYRNLDVLAENMLKQAVRVEAEDVLDLPEVTYVPVIYSLPPPHQRLYDKVVEDLLVVLDDGVILDGTVPQRLYHTAQRAILMPMEFGGAKIEPVAFSLIDEMVMESGGEKIIIFCHHNTANEAVFEYTKKLGLNPVIAYGGKNSSSAKNLKAVEQFLKDPSVKALVGNPGSIGVGLNLQSVCRLILFLELPITCAQFIQAVGRIKREGQKKNCVIKMAIAAKTIQAELRHRVVKKEDIVQEVMPTKESLRRALYGA